MSLRLTGATYADIGSMMGISSTGAYKAVLRAIQRLAEQTTETADEYRRLELERLDKMQRNLWTQTLQGSQGAVDRVLKIMERRAKLLGLDAPVKQDITSGGKTISVREVVVEIPKETEEADE